MKHHIVSVALTALFLATSALVWADYPKPAAHPTAWEFNLSHGVPKRVVVEVPGSSVPQAYWYMLYTVTNNSDQERDFLPVFEMVTDDGKIVRSDINIPAKVFTTIKDREKRQFLEPFPKITGQLRLGEDQAKDGVAIWVEPTSRMGSFTIYAAGLSGEFAVANDAKGEPIKNAEGKPTVLRKTLKIDYQVRGDEVYPGEDLVNLKGQEWVMR